MKIGDKVVCINNEGSPGRRWYGDIPIVSRIYTITGWYNDIEFQCLCLTLAEITNEPKHLGTGYRAIRFAPLIEQGGEVHVEQTRTDDGENPNPNFVGETLVQKQKMDDLWKQ